MIKYFLLILFISIGAGLVWFFKSGFLFQESYAKASVYIRGEEFIVDVAESLAQKSKGLGGRESLRPNEGMLFLFDPPTIRKFWMKDMAIPIDILWIKEKKIVGIEENVLPEPGVPIHKLRGYKSPETVDMVLEISTGLSEDLGILVGDEVAVVFR